MANERSGTTLGTSARATQVRDRSLPDSGGVLTGNRGCSEGCEYTGPSQDPHIPEHRDFTEVALHEGDEEACAAANVDAGGTVREVNTKAVRGPAIAFLSKGQPMNTGVVSKAAHVVSHPQLMRAHQAGSYTKDDHTSIHGAVKCNPAMKESGEGPLPKGGEGVEEALDEKCAAVASTVGSPSSAGCTMPAVTQKAHGPVVATPRGQAMRSRD